MKVNYQNTIIYKLCCKDVNVKEIYVGHTTNFKLRNQSHKTNSNNVNSEKYNAYKYQFIRDNGGYENWKMVMIKEFPCNSKQEALMEEDKVIRELNATLNSMSPYRSEEEKKEYYKEYNKEYRENNLDKLKKKNKEWRDNNKEHLKEYEDKRRNDPEFIKWRKEYEQKRSKKPERIEYNKKRRQDPKYIEYEKERKEKAKQNKIICEFCNCELRADSLKRHITTNKKCLAIQEQINN